MDTDASGPELRRTFITHARSGGARPDVLKWATHGPSGDIIDIYTSMPWEPLCEAVSCLKLDLLEDEDIPLTVQNFATAGGAFLQSRSETNQPRIIQYFGVKCWRSGRDSNERFGHSFHYGLKRVRSVWTGEKEKSRGLVMLRVSWKMRRRDG